MIIRKIILVIGCFLSIASTTQAQELVTLQKWSNAQVEKEIENGIASGRKFVGYALPAKANLSVKQQDNLWVYEQIISVSNVQALNIRYFNWKLPINSEVVITNLKSFERTISPTRLVQANNNLHFSSGIIDGDSLLVQIISQQALSQIPELNEVSVFIDQKNNVLKSGACQVNVDCSEGDNWRNQINSVVHIITKVGFSYYACSGVVVNNATYDCTPYVLSAWHCSYDSNADDYDGYEFYFNYQYSNCGGSSFSKNQFLRGCVKRADSNDDAGDTGSDFVLLELVDQIPSSFNAYYAGWNVDGNSSNTGVSIHHPNGDPKTISTYKTFLQSDKFSNNAPGYSHWRVNWFSTVNGFGTTEQGSSGSPIFDSEGLVIGTLTGGGSSCSNTGAPDFYGKMSYHWTGNPNSENQKLKVWLDPANTGVKEIEGTYYPCTSPTDNDAGIISVLNSGLSCSTNLNLQYTIKNFGEETLERVNITIKVNNATQVSFVHPTNLATGITEVLNNNVVLAEGKNNIQISTTLPNGIVDNNSINDAGNTVLYKGSASEITRVRFQPDCDPEQVSFDLFAEDNTLLTSVNTGSLQAGVNNFDYCLPQGCYYIRLFDTGENGLSNNTCGEENASVKIIDNEQTELAFIEGNNDLYTNTASFGFCNNVIQNIDETSFKIIPSLVSSEQKSIEIAFDKVVLLNLEIVVYDLAGNIMLEAEAYVFKKVILDISKLKKGMYILQLTTDNKKITERFIKL